MRRKRPTVAEQVRLGAYFFTTGAIDLAIAQFTAATKRAPHSATAWMKSGIGIRTGQPVTQTGSWQRRQRSASKPA